MHSHAFNPSPLPLRSLLKTLALLAVLVLVMSYTYWVHVAGVGVGVSVEKGMDESVDEPTGKGWGVGRGQHSGASADAETGHEIDSEGMLGGGGGDGRTDGGQSKGDEEEDGERVTHNGLLRLGGGGHANGNEELQEMDLSPGWQTAQASALPTPQPKKPFKPGFQGVHLDEEQEEGGGGGGAAFLDIGGSKGGYPGLLTDEKVAKKMGLVVASKEEVEAWVGFWGGREEGEKTAGEMEGSGLGEGDMELGKEGVVGDEKEGAKPSEEGSTDIEAADDADAAKGTGAENGANLAAEVEAKSGADTYADGNGEVAKAADVKKGDEGEDKDDQRGGVEKNTVEEAEVVAVADEEPNGGQRGGEEPKWTPLKEAGEREVSNILMDHDSLPD